ncbi:MAG: tyrosine-type recombinase/integrase [Phycisphaerae bacterium]|nr:tyrosine-type recombinase/integrase [Phycisphaerae bacterium]
MEIEKWLAYCQRYYTPRTIRLYRSCITQFETYLSNDGNQLTSEAIDAYIGDRLAVGWSKRYVNCNLSVIKSYCRWCSEHYHETNQASSIPMLHEDPPKQRVLSDEEYQKILAAISGRDKDIIVFLANTGLRVSEFTSLTWEDITSDFKSLSVVGKGRKVRMIPLNQTCRDILAKYKSQGMTGRLPFSRMHRVNVGKICMRVAKKAGIAQFGPHACRHCFATQLMRRGVSIYKISKILGHASIAVTEKVYVHFCQQDVLGITDCLDN